MLTTEVAAQTAVEGGGWTGYVRGIWDSRMFWGALAVLDLRKKYRRSALGFGWAMLQPIAMTAVICGVFAGAFQVSFVDHFVYVLTGLCTWNFLASAIREGSGSIYWSETYIRQHRKPLVIYPLRIVAAAVIHFAGSLVPILAWSVFTGHMHPATAVTLPLLGLLFGLLAWGLATVAAIVTVYFADASQLLELALQLGFYATPVIYHESMLRNRGLGWLVDWNPAAAVLSAVRAPILNHALPTPVSIGVLLLSIAVVWGCAITLLRLVERRIIFHL